MASRLQLHAILCDILGPRAGTSGNNSTDYNVYFQPPASVKMQYPAIRYSLSDIDIIHADNRVYKQTTYYEIVVIDPNPDSEIVARVSGLTSCRFDRYYVSDNLNHYVFTIH